MTGFRHLDDPNFDYDPMTGVKQSLTIDNEGVMHFQSSQDDSDIRKYAHESRSNYSKHDKMGDLAPVARLPVLVMYDLIKRGIWGDKKRLYAWYNSVEAAPYRLREFRM